MSLLLRVTLVLAFATAARAAQEEPIRLPGDPAELPSVMHCPVQGHEVTDRSRVVEWRGRRYFLGTDACVEKFMEDPETFARTIEPRAALFRSQSPSEMSYGPGFLLASLLIVLGLVSGGASSYVAVQKGHPPVPWFLAGLFLNVVALAAIATRDARSLRFTKEGLTKMPQTHAPNACPSCARDNHPLAESCAGCGAELSPDTTSEAARVLRGSR